MDEFDAFRNERATLAYAESLLKRQKPDCDFRAEFADLLASYKKLFKTSRRLVRMSDRNEERLKEANIRIKKQQERLENEMQFAKGIQMSMVPGGGLASVERDGYTLFAYLRPARSIGGDLYYFQQNGKWLNFLIGDVSDKGVPAALFMAKTITLYINALNEGLAPDSIFSQMNNALCVNNEACMFVTALCGHLDLESGRLIISNAGHMNPILSNAHRHGELVVDSEMALGLFEDIIYRVSEYTVAKGSRLLMYTDGIIEANNADGAQYQENRLLEFTRSRTPDSSSRFGEALLEDVEKFVDGAEQSDDITLLVIHYEA